MIHSRRRTDEARVACHNLVGCSRILQFITLRLCPSWSSLQWFVDHFTPISSNSHVAPANFCVTHRTYRMSTAIERLYDSLHA